MSKLECLINNLIKKASKNNSVLLENTIKVEIGNIFGNDDIGSIFDDVCNHLNEAGIHIDYNVDIIDVGVVDNVIGSYIIEANSMPKLSKEELNALILKSQKGDNQAKEIVLKSNIKLVISLCSRYRDCGVDLEDLVQVGLMGLMSSIDKYKPSLGYAFSTYAAFWIKKGIIDELSDNSRTIRMPKNRFNDYHKLGKFQLDFIKKYNKDATIEDMCKHLGKSEKYVLGLLNTPEVTMSLDTVVVDGGKPAFLSEIIEDEETSVEEECFKNTLSVELDKLISQLPEKQEKALRMRYGLDGTGVDKSYKECAAELGVSNQRANQLVQSAIKGLLKLDTNNNDSLSIYLGV